MKRILLAGIIMLSSVITFAQTDTSGKGAAPDTAAAIRNSGDTVFVGNFIIIRNNKNRDTYNDSLPPKREDYTIINLPGRRFTGSRGSNKRITTNFLIFDLGFANYNDRTDYSAPETAQFAEPGITKRDMRLITGKSSNVNIWLFMQKLNLEKHVLNLKYGLGLNMYNYRWSSNIGFRTSSPFVVMDTVDFSKNKLYVGYATIPLMLNVTPWPSKRRSFNFSAGVSASYRIGTRTKQISRPFGRVRTRNDFSVNDWLFAYTGEIGLGPVRIYGMYSINTLFENAKHYPYTVGIRFSNW